MPSKAQGLSLNTIIIATIVLLVLLLLVGLLTGFFNKKWNPGFGALTDTSCKGSVKPAQTGCAADENQDYAAQVDSGKVCCISAASQSSSVVSCNKNDNKAWEPPGSCDGIVIGTRPSGWECCQHPNKPPVLGGKA